MKRLLQRLLSHPILISLGVLVIAVVVFAKQYPETWSSWFADSPLTKSAGAATTAVKHADASTQGRSGHAEGDEVGAHHADASDAQGADPGADPWHGYAQAPLVPQQMVAAAGQTMAAGPLPASLDAAQAELLATARQAFWQRDYSTAEKTYRALLDDIPNAAGAHGELGNLYLAMGRPEAAAEEYLAAGRALMAMSRTAEAAAVVPMLAAIDADKAQLLASEIRHSATASAVHGGSTQPAPLSEQQIQQLMSARTAFWQRDIDAAVRQYLALIEQRQDAPDLEGELGNLFFAIQDWQRAAEHYGNAAQKLLDAGRLQEASAMIPLVGQLDPQRAAQLQQNLAKAGAGQP